ncbi:MAG: DUF521 domain-containing protein, partial [Clostridia bacterium]|nr:DUF521 domain-containing protein [Clostridia bacterium]
MQLTKEQQQILDGGKGEVMAKVMETVIRYGELFGAERLVPVTSKYNHLVLHAGADYALLKNVSIFAKVNNLLNKEYVRHDGYPAQKLNLLA